MPPKLDTPIKPVSKAASSHRPETVNKASTSTDSISNADLMAVLTTFKSDVLASNKSLSDLHATQYKDLKSDLADVSSQMTEMRKENARLQNEIDFLKEKVATLENSNVAAGSDLVVSQVLEETIERDKCRSNLIIYGVTESTFGAIAQRISYDRSTITDILKPLGDVIPPNTKLVRLGKVPSDSARPIKIIFDSNEAATNLLSKFNVLKRSGTIFPNGFRIGSDKTLLQRKLLRSCHSELDRRVKNGEANLRIKFHNGTPKIASETSKNRIAPPHHPANHT